MRLDTRPNSPWRFPLVIALGLVIWSTWEYFGLDPRDETWARNYLIEKGYNSPEIIGRGSGGACWRRENHRTFQFRAYDASGSPTRGTLCCGQIFCNVRESRW